MRHSFLFRSLALALAFAPTFVLFQNCSDISIESFQDSSVGLVDVQNETSLWIPPSPVTQFRAVFVLDVSNSMMFGPCRDSVDVLIPQVEAHPRCTSESGADPQGKRFRMLLAWVSQVRALLETAPDPRPTVKFSLIPFAGKTTKNSFGHMIDISDSKSVLRKMLAAQGILTSNQLSYQFMSLDDFEKTVQTTWAFVQLFYHFPLPVEISPSVVRAVEQNIQLAQSGAVGGRGEISTGTSIPFPALEFSNRVISDELSRLQLTAPKKSRFEVVYLSDGVPKPHSDHIEEVIKLLWSTKKSACNTEYTSGYACCDQYPGISDGCGWETVKNGSSCLQRCKPYLASYVDTGSVNIPASETVRCIAYNAGSGSCDIYSNGSAGPFQDDSMKCGPCFDLLKQYNYGPGSSTSYHQIANDFFKRNIQTGWGDWLLNRPSQIFNQIYTTTNLFRKQYPGTRWRLNFIRIDSDKAEDKIQVGELKPEINWFEKAKEIYPRKHRHLVWSQAEPPFSLFSEMEDLNTYRLSKVIAYPRHARSSAEGWSLDSDADGVSDLYEVTDRARTLPRSNGTCLDLLVSKYGGCVTQGCEPSLDLDKDGLNQCEERTIGSDEEIADTDDDGILDVLEVVFGFIPTLDDNQVYLSADGLSNYEHFRRGYSGQVDLSKIPDQMKLKVSSDYLGFRSIQSAFGQTVLAPTYKIQISHIPQIPLQDGGQLRVLLAVENQKDPTDKLWLFKDYRIIDLDKGLLTVRFDEFQLLNLEAP